LADLATLNQIVSKVQLDASDAITQLGNIDQRTLAYAQTLQNASPQVENLAQKIAFQERQLATMLQALGQTTQKYGENSTQAQRAELAIAKLSASIQDNEQKLKSALQAGTDWSQVWIGAQRYVGEIAVQAVQVLGQGLLQLGRDAFESYEQNERLQLSLQTLVARELQTADATKTRAQALAEAAPKAQELLQWNQQLAINSPFTEESVAQTFRQIEAYGFVSDSADKTAVTAKRLTQDIIDFTAGSGQSQEVAQRVALALGQIESRGKLAGQEVMQLTEAGISVDKILSQAFHKPISDIIDMREKGLIPADKAVKAIAESMEKDFGGAAKAQSGTMEGLLNSLGDLEKISGRNILSGIFDAAKEPLQELVTTLQSPEFQQGIKEVGQDIGALAREVLPLLVQQVKETSAGLHQFADDFTTLRTAAQPTIDWLDQNVGPVLQKLREIGDVYNKVNFLNPITQIRNIGEATHWLADQVRDHTQAQDDSMDRVEAQRLAQQAQLTQTNAGTQATAENSQALEENNKALQKLADQGQQAYGKLTESSVKFYDKEQDAAAEHHRKIAQIQSESANKLTDLEEQTNDKRQSASQSFHDKVADDQRTASQKLTEDWQQYLEKRNDIADQHDQKLADIQKRGVELQTQFEEQRADASGQYEDKIANVREAATQKALDAQQSYADKITDLEQRNADLQETYAEQQADRQAQFESKLTDLKQQFDDSEIQRQQSHQDKVQNAEQDHQDKLESLQRQYDQTTTQAQRESIIRQMDDEKESYAKKVDRENQSYAEAEQRAQQKLARDQQHAEETKQREDAQAAEKLARDQRHLEEQRAQEDRAYTEQQSRQQRALQTQLTDLQDAYAHDTQQRDQKHQRDIAGLQQQTAEEDTEYTKQQNKALAHYRSEIEDQRAKLVQQIDDAHHAYDRQESDLDMHYVAAREKQLRAVATRIETEQAAYNAEEEQRAEQYAREEAKQLEHLGELLIKYVQQQGTIRGLDQEEITRTTDYLREKYGVRQTLEAQAYTASTKAIDDFVSGAKPKFEDLGTSLDTTTRSAVAQQQTFDDKLTKSVDAVARQFSDGKISIDDYAKSLQTIPAQVSTELLVKQTTYTAADAAVGASPNEGVGAPHAVGGAVDAGYTYRVNEDGTEWFQSAGSGTIIPIAPPGAQGQGSSVVVQVYVSGSVISEQDLVDAVYAGLLKKQRQNYNLGFT
jgi:tape measure domain-containing protein